MLCILQRTAHLHKSPTLHQCDAAQRLISLHQLFQQFQRRIIGLDFIAASLNQVPLTRQAQAQLQQPDWLGHASRHRIAHHPLCRRARGNAQIDQFGSGRQIQCHGGIHPPHHATSNQRAQQQGQHQQAKQPFFDSVQKQTLRKQNNSAPHDNSPAAKTGARPSGPAAYWPHLHSHFFTEPFHDHPCRYRPIARLLPRQFGV